MTKYGFELTVSKKGDNVVMSRISIDVTPEQHNRSKAFAALTGKSLKDYIFEKTLPTNDEFKELEDLGLESKVGL